MYSVIKRYAKRLFDCDKQFTGWQFQSCTLVRLTCGPAGWRNITKFRQPNQDARAESPRTAHARVHFNSTAYLVSWAYGEGGEGGLPGGLDGDGVSHVVGHQLHQEDVPDHQHSTENFVIKLRAVFQ